MKQKQRDRRYYIGRGKRVTSHQMGGKRVRQADILSYLSRVHTPDCPDRPSPANSEAVKRAKLDLPYLIAGELKPGKRYRGKGNICGVNLLCIDLDNPTSNSEVLTPETIEAINPYTHVRYHTLTSTPQRPKCRIIFPLTPGVFRPEEYGWMVNQVVLTLFRGIQVDPCSYTVNQPMFLPVIYSNDTDIQHYTPRINKGIQIDSDSLIFSGRSMAGEGNKSSIGNPPEGKITTFEASTRTHAQKCIPLTPVDNIRVILSGISPDLERGKWIKVCAGLKNEAMRTQDTERCESIKQHFVAWSRGDYTQTGQRPRGFVSDQDCLNTWQSLRGTPPEGVEPATLGTVIYLASSSATNPNPNPNQKIDNMLDLGGDILSLLPRIIEEGWVYLANCHSMLRRGEHIPTPVEGFNTLYALEFSTPGNLTKKGTRKAKPFDVLLGSGMLQKYRDGVYLPGPPESINREGDEVYNSYVPPNPPPPVAPYSESLDLVERFTNHISQVWGEDHTIILDYISYLVQNPDKRIFWCLILQGEKGIGKSLVKEVLSETLGRGNVTDTSSDSIMSPFMTWAYGSRVTIMEELKLYGKEKYKAAERLKAYITNPSIVVNEKHRRIENVVNTVSYVGLTNHLDAVPIEKDDRRYCILASDTTASQVRQWESDNLFPPMFEEIRSNGQHFIDYFRTRRISDTFRAESRPPATKGSWLARKLSKTPLELDIDTVLRTCYPGTETTSATLITYPMVTRMNRKLFRGDRKVIMRYLISEYNFTLSEKEVDLFGQPNIIMYKRDMSEFKIANLVSTFRAEQFKWWKKMKKEEIVELVT